MKREDALKIIKTKFKNDILGVFEKSPKRIYIDIKAQAVKPMCKYIFRDMGARFNIASGLETRTDIEILYHFTMEDLNVIISLRVKLPKDNPVIDSISTEFEAANWIEREIDEMLGVEFKGHPDPRRLLLSDEWPKGVYPLRNDYQEWDKKAVRDRGV